MSALRRFWYVPLFILVFIWLVMATSKASGDVAQAKPADCQPAWAAVPPPGGVTPNNELTGVAAVTSRDVWAVGYYRTSGYQPHGQTVIEHWDGSQWNRVPSPDGGTS